MSLATLPVATPGFTPAPQPVRWTVAEFHRLLADPAYERRKMFLVDGEILEMPIPNPPHYGALGLVDEALRSALGPKHFVRSQMPLVLNQSTDPMPDLAVVPGSPRDYAGHPQTALLVVEVADSSLAYDMREKAHAYAAGGIADYWVVDLVHRKLHVYRDPVADPASPSGARYRTTTSHDPGEAVAPLAAPHGAVKVADLLP
jgi:Uma2 family endonuclease